MKKFLLVLISVTSIVQSYSQTAIATLCHNDSISWFYGINALAEAYDAASEGDVITLSSGQFNSVHIKKPITVRGAGMDLINYDDRIQEPTILIGNFQVATSALSNSPLIIEGIRVNGSIVCYNLGNFTLSKCRVPEISSSAGMTINAKFIHCIIENIDGGSTPNVSITAYNSILQNIYTKKEDSCDFTNCIIDVSHYPLECCSLRNCILISSYEKRMGLGATNVAYNCVWYGSTATEPFTGDNATRNNKLAPESQPLFEEGTFYELSEAGKEYLGLDDTEVGIYGGDFPFKTIPNVPQITKCKVASKTTADGKLSVEIEVKSAE